jgi:hypothetical protein
MKQLVKISAIALAALSLLTACDPPIPQSILVARAEAQVECGDPGEISIYSDYGFADLGATWIEMIGAACPDITISQAESVEDGDLVLSSLAAPCEPTAQAPVAFDAAAIVFYLDEAFAINLSAEAVQGIFSGGITNWSDPALSNDNPEIAFPDLEITVEARSQEFAIAAMERWSAAMTGSEVDFNLLQPVTDTIYSDMFFEFMPGTIGLIPMSDALTAGATPSNIVIADGTAVVPEQQSIYSASTMFGFDALDSLVSASFDGSVKPRPSPGTTEVAVPYEALYPINLAICGEDSLTKRAVARYVVRLDSQGVVATSSLVAVGEDLRVASAIALGAGLPQPDLTDLSE